MVASRRRVRRPTRQPCRSDRSLRFEEYKLFRGIIVSISWWTEFVKCAAVRGALRPVASFGIVVSFGSPRSNPKVELNA